MEKLSMVHDKEVTKNNTHEVRTQCGPNFSRGRFVSFVNFHGLNVNQ